MGVYAVKLGKKQESFADNLGRLISWIYANGMACRLGECHRTREQAELYAAQGKGIKNSVHCVKLAIDLFLVIGGKVTWNAEDYRSVGEHWKSLHPLARHGLDFRNRDAVHFSYLHNGVC